MLSRFVLAVAFLGLLSVSLLLLTSHVGLAVKLADFVFFLLLLSVLLGFLKNEAQSK